MSYTTSRDGTRISYDILGRRGPALVLVGGGLDDGGENIPLGEWLASRFTVVNYSRRGRGGSGDTAPYAVQREIEDLAAVIEATGSGPAHLFGASSGGALALEATAAGLPINRVAVHEVPYQTTEDMVAAWHDYTRELADTLYAGDMAGALRLFMRLAGASGEQITAAESTPMWPGLLSLAPTLRYDAACIGAGPPPRDRLARVTQPVLLTTSIAGDVHMAGLPADYFGSAADAAAACLPSGQHVTIPATGHVADPAHLGPVLTAFFLEKE
ncbi:hydrolase [Prauserella marina]|uniref:Pimeloyl-ACP methyl ester carboxylesterase n=1 Tax=Prauserella marina TaxID=530584 RepID=A0A222VN20_9PSEU|nr:alpha/beta hydrolase [Prauserella marina]ASR35252.1 hydrolase [Prauserella marina]PWV84972.1 pimeloyl-ACP methyl ester carboxylesterase [Prauserella marina]SDC07939.1 Pimeloyl-ACP methyl ester carboxylesterase [Prauserella marina]